MPVAGHFGITSLGFTQTINENHEPLHSGNDGTASNEVVVFVTDVTNPKAATYVEPSKRIAVFDNDGTLSIYRARSCGRVEIQC